MEPNTPKTANSVSMYPSDALRCVAQSMKGKDHEMTVTLPLISSWKEVLHATESALGEFDDTFMVVPKRTEAQRKRLREKARQRLKESAKLLDKDFRQPYPITLAASITEETLAIVKARVMLTGLNGMPDDPDEEFKSIDVLWDTGAHQTLITEELLSDSFRRSLQDPMHDQYRSKDATLVQLQALIAFSNSVIKISCIALIVPKNQVPNQRVGIIFGQSQCIDRISYRCIPRQILRAKGVEIGDDVWGDMVIDGYIDEDEKLVSV